MDLMLHPAPRLADFAHGAWDALLLLCADDLSALPAPLRAALDDARALDEALLTPGEAHLALLPAGAWGGGRRLVVAGVGDLKGDGDDVRRWRDAAAAAARRALAAGALRPCLALAGVPARGPLAALHARAYEVAALGALSALWQPLEAREQGRGRAFEALGLCLEGAAAPLSAPGAEGDEARARWARWVSAAESGRGVARDVAGTNPERMAPPQVEDLCKRLFRDSAVQVEVLKAPDELLRDYPLLSAVARASMEVKRHQPRVVRLTYEGAPREGAPLTSLYLAGKGVTYDTGGADLKTDGHMAGMSRDKGGAAAVVGLFRTLALLRPAGLRVVAELGVVRNSIGADAFVSDEIIPSHAGVRVRIGNTDAEGRLVLADLLSHLRAAALARAAAHPGEPQRLFSVATLTGHAGRAVGTYTIALDSSAAEEQGVARALAEAGERVGDCVELSRLRREDFDFVRPRSLADDLLSCNNAPSSATPRGHQFPMAFLIKASGLGAHGRFSEAPLCYTHIDIGGSGVEGGDWQHGRPTAAPLLAWLEAWVAAERG